MKSSLALLSLLLTALPAYALDQTTLDLSLEPPVINTQPGPEYADEVRTGNMIIGLEQTAKGRLWACWVGNGDNPNGFFMLATSDDGGKTWSKPRLVIDPTDPPNAPQRRALVGNLWTDPLGRLWLFFDQSLGYFDGRSGDWFIRCDNPDAAEPIWTAPVRFADGCTLNKPTVLQNGDWLLPVSLWTRDRIGPASLKDAHKNLDPIRMANVFVSTDQGKTWTRRGGVAFPGTDFDEHMMVERKDGSLWMLARTKEGISESVSKDLGSTWSTPQPSDIRNPSARFFIRRLASGNLLLVKNGPLDVRLPRRSSLTAFLSLDDGKTWPHQLLLDDRAEVSYPDGFQAPDGTVHILYDWNRHTDAEILLAKFREDDLIAGRFATPGSQPRLLVNKARSPLPPASIRPDPKWTAQAAEDAKQDLTSIPYDGVTPNKLVCDTTLRELPDGSWALFMLAGDDFEPSPKNYTGVTRSLDHGKTWSPLAPVDIGFPREGLTAGQGPTELLVQGNQCTLWFSTHSQTWGRDWQSWLIRSSDNCRTWTKPEPVPGRLGKFSFLRNHIVTRDGRILVPFQHYAGPPAGAPPPPPEEKPWHKTLFHYVSNPRNGVLMSCDGGKTWTEHGNIRLTPDDRYHGWAENNIVELKDGRIAMIIRADRLGRVLFSAESLDGGRTWPKYASLTQIPNPGAKATLYGLGGDAVALLHNPNSRHRSPLALWISFDGMKTWPYQRVLQETSCDGPKGAMNYPDGFVSQDRQWLHFAFDDNRHRAVHYSAKLPPLPAATVATAAPVVQPRTEAQAVEQAHAELWKRFVNAHGLLNDYTALDGTVSLPSPEECQADKPNALGWWTPIENGPFFGGLYLDAQCQRWRATKTPATAEEARKVARGLLALAGTSDRPGFIARGFATDGRAHYAASSSDQTYPWFYGLWRYATSGVPDAAERQQLANTLKRVALGLEANEWKMPCDREGFGHFGHWTGGFPGSKGTLSGAEPQFDAAVRLLFVLRAVHQLTGEASWLEKYRARLAEKPSGSEKTRLQICAEGVRYVAPGEPPRYPESPPIWTSASSQAGLRALLELEADPALRAQFQQGLDANAGSAAPFVARYRTYDDAKFLAFDPNWRALNAAWRPQADIGEAVKLATEQYRLWNKQSPRRLAEADQMRDPLFAAWIVALSGNSAIIDPARPDIRGALTHYRWEKLNTCLFFMAECVYWQLQPPAQ